MIYSQANAVVTNEDGRSGQLHITARYATADPFVITFDLGSEEWAIGRNLLATGLTENAGEMMVRVETGDFHTALTLDQCDGTPAARITFPKRWLHTFLQRTARLVPVGSEMQFIDLDAGLRELLNG